MPKYRKIPIVVEAFLLDNDRPKIEWFNELFENGEAYWLDEETVYILTLEGEMRADIGQHYIIKGVQGEVYPCRKDIFEQTYEEVV